MRVIRIRAQSPASGTSIGIIRIKGGKKPALVRPICSMKAKKPENKAEKAQKDKEKAKKEKELAKKTRDKADEVKEKADKVKDKADKVKDESNKVKDKAKKDKEKAKEDKEKAKEDEKSAEMGKTMEVPMRVVGKDGETKARLDAEIADNHEKRIKGLSKRANLPEGRGMFFDTPGPFWMKDVNMPLDIAFMSKEGQIVYTSSMKPADLHSFSVKLYRSPDKTAEYAVEVPGGWLAKHNIKKGDYIEIDN